jgi:(1->4)-alpha-D-glucan 1-alpha-D-glucosylmutase
VPSLRLLDRLCALCGIQTEYVNDRGETVRLSAEAKRVLLKAMGIAVDEQARLPKLLSALEDRDWRRLLPPVKVVRAEAGPCVVECTLPDPVDRAPVAWTLDLETGERWNGTFHPAELSPLAERAVQERIYRRYALTLPGVPPPGYHRFALECPDQGLGADMTLIAAPIRCYMAPILEEKERVWGLSLPLYAVRSQRNWGMGDFSDLRGLVDYTADRGAALIRLNPLDALQPANPGRCNPYEPSNRLFFNVLYLDPEAVPDYGESEAAQKAVAEPEFQARLRSLRAEEWVNCREVAAAKLEIAAVLFAHFRERHFDSGARGDGFRAWRAVQGEALFRQTLFDALSEYFAVRDPDLSAWTDWPDGYADPDSVAARTFAEQNAGRLDFYAYLYWQAELQFEAAGRRSLEAGLTIGLCQDFVFDAAWDGAEVWAAPAWHAGGVRVGSPPAAARPEGRVSGAAPFLPQALVESAYAPFVAALRHNMRHAGALMIHGVTGLWRQFWIPADGSPEDGGWIGFPCKDLLGILALESRRNRCMILAADPAPSEDIREALENSGILPFRSLLGDSRDLSGFAARDVPHYAAVATATGDEPTLRGFWLGRDLDEKAALRLFATESERHEEAVARAVARVRLLVALEREGLLPAEVSIHPVSVPDMTTDLMAAIYRYLCRMPARIVLMRLEDALGQADPVALPGAPADYPNWRRKLPLEFEQWRREESVAALMAAMAEIRSGAARVSPKPRPAGLGGVIFTIPRATYRIQFSRQFTFRQATELVSYLHELGVSHCYASPYLKARPGSSHGYDIVDHGALNPEIGSRADFERFVRELARRGMGHILDLVPNHMGVMGSDNVWWLDVLENGEASDYAGFFDIDWAPVKDTLRGKVLLPTLGSPYGAALENGEIELVFDPEEGAFSAWYGPHRFPIDPREYPRVLGYRLDQLEGASGVESPWLAEFQSLITAFGHLPGRWQMAESRRAERNRDKEVHKRHLARLYAENQDVARFVARNVAEFNGTPGLPASFDRLHDLLEHQAYRLAYWRIAADEINYRRFFDINDLAALSMENEEVFDRTHGLVLDLIAEGKLHGLRIDHPDGLYDPEAYFRRLQERIAALARTRPAEDAHSSPGVAGEGREDGTAGEHRNFYVVAEKILETDEELPTRWPVHGTTGYDFANLVNGILRWPEAERELDRFYRGFCGFPIELDELLYQSKRLILKVALSAELSVLANRLGRIAESDRRTRDFSLTGLRDALREIIACFPVYRTYIAGLEVSERDAAYIGQAVGEAKRRSPVGDPGVFDFIGDVLLMAQVDGKSERYREQVVSFAMKFQQVTGPVMAKSMEDTVFYRYLRLASLNEVGGDPRRFAIPLEEFHRCNRERAELWPHALLSTSTHDTKRSEDVRARIDVLSEVPEAWTAAVSRWNALNRRHKTPVDGEPAPSNNDEYLIYQTLAGTWPLAELDPDALSDYRSRLEAYLLKAMREAKLFSSWLNPNQAYEDATLNFLAGLLDTFGPNEFLADFLAFQADLIRPGFHNSLAQLLLKLTVPGVPDIYQGNELWDFSLVDPDNRRPVDYRRRRTLLQELKSWDSFGAERLAGCLAELASHSEDGRIKLYVTREALRLRRQNPELFRCGGYRPLAAQGGKAGHLCAFLRGFESRAVLIAAPRWTRRLLGAEGSLGDPAVWAGTRIPLPAGMSGAYVNCFTRERLVLDQELAAADLFSRFPLALLVKADPD